MERYDIYKDIASRTQGDIYILSLIHIYSRLF